MKPLEVSPSQYHSELKLDRSNIFSKDSFLSKSSVWELDSCSLYKWRYCPKDFKPTTAMQWGSLIDCLTTTPEDEDNQIAVSEYDSYRSDEAREWRDAQLEAGKIIVTQSEMEEAQKAADMLLNKNAHSAEIFKKSKTQVILYGVLQGLNVKGLVDLAPAGEDYLADLKTTNDFSLGGFEKTISKFGYHVQAGLYLKLWNKMFPEDQRNGFRIIWQDSKAPYEVVVTELSAFDIDAGADYFDYLLSKLAKAANNNSWGMLHEGLVPMIARSQWDAEREEEKMGAIAQAPKIEGVA